jgi:hypothetical protein
MFQESRSAGGFRCIARVMSAIGAVVSHFSLNSPKLDASQETEFFTLLSIGRDRPLAMAA